MSTCKCACHLPAVIAEDLRRQLAEEDAAVVRRMREASWDISAAVDWRKEAEQPSYAELQRRRGEAS